jgi:hypothetical protein
VHRLIDPIAIPEIPENAAHISEPGGLQKTKRLTVALFSRECNEERDKTYPAEDPSPPRHGTFYWKWKDLQTCRDE